MPTTAAIPVRALNAREADRAATLITLSFVADPPSRWLWPDRAQFLHAFPRFVHAFGGGAFETGAAHATADFNGVALWLPPGASSDDAALEQLFNETVSDELKTDVFLLFEQMAAYHPSEPHWHLPLIGVDPAFQHRGIGGALLRHALEKCDRDGLPAYLEATSRRNAALYARHGFERIGTIQSGDSPEIIPMLRNAR
ncbi:MAG: GNAT family N-acetyltransferase [Phycisphaerales bacterium]